MKRLMLSAFLVLGFGCSNEARLLETNASREFSKLEQDYLAAQAPNSEIAVLVYRDGKLSRHVMAASQVASFQEKGLADHSDAVYALDFPVHYEDIQEDFSGKAEFDLTSWKAEAPEADGRGVKIAVVDDGVGLKRAGLEKTTTGAPKLARFINMQPRWKQTLELSQLPYSFELSNCGIVRATDRPLKKCHDLGPDFADGKKVSATLKLVDGKYRLALANGRELEAVSDNQESRIDLADGTAWGFDVDATATNATLYLKLPERAATGAGIRTGSHGEGVAGIAAGHRLGNLELDGVAPGAQVVDVHFTDPTDPYNYTIGLVLNSLIEGGKHAHLVNLSYSLYFDNPVAQIAMGRLMEAALKDLNAVFFFSAGNNGPGIGSMNRALLYPSFGIPVAAYLSGRLAQTTFGSAGPLPLVAPYSSVGPGIDGGSGALLLSPLAGMSSSTSDGGYQPFSGTSSATPALAGFSARLLSRIFQENLAWDRDLFRQALLRSAKPLPNVPFISQGYGLPSLPDAFKAYGELLANKTHPKLSVAGAHQLNGTPARGIYVRSPEQLLSQYVFNLSLSFPAGLSPEEQANALEELKIETTAPFIQAPDRLLVSRGAASVQVTIDRTRLGDTGGKFGEIRFTMLSTGQVVTVPVTILVPERSMGDLKTISIAKGSETRVFFEVKRAHSSLFLQLQGREGICGRVGVYTPSSIRIAEGLQSERFSQNLIEQRYPLAQPGVYELVIEGRQNHRVCPSDQTLAVRAAVVSSEFSAIQQRANALDWTLATDIDGDDLARAAMEVSLEDPVTVQSLPLVVSGADRSTYRTTAPFTVPAETTARLFYAEAASFTGITRFSVWNVIEENQENTVDISVSMAEGGYLGALSNSATPASLVWTRFEQGLAATDLPTTLGRAELWFQPKAEAKSKLPLGWFDPTTVGMKTSTIATTGARQWSCRMKPAGFITVTASCGRVELQ